MGITKQMQLEEREAEDVCMNCSHWNYNEDADDEEPGMRFKSSTGICGEDGGRTSPKDNCGAVKDCGRGFEHYLE
jgi:hypothetical protein